MKPIIAPSLLSCDFSRISDVSEMLNRSEADWFHLDVMDGVFVPNISFGLPIIKAFRKCTDKILDVHLMIADADKYISDFARAGANILTVHYEACTHLQRTIQSIKSAGMKAGVALNPHSSVQLLEEIVSELDIVLIMSVNPGFGGQSFIESTYQKIQACTALIKKKNAKTIIEVDGGVTLENAPLLIKAGAHALVAGSTVFNSPNPTDTIHRLKHI